jgi:hypothetical protein
MPTPRLTSEQVSRVSGLVSQYITAQRQNYGSRAITLSARRGCDGRILLAATSGGNAASRPQSRAGCQPCFLPRSPRTLGFSNLPNQSRMGAITFCHVAVSRQPFYDGLLFHELVHVEQYRQLGIPRFSELYVRGFLKGGSNRRFRWK